MGSLWNVVAIQSFIHVLEFFVDAECRCRMPDAIAGAGGRMPVVGLCLLNHKVLLASLFFLSSSLGNLFDIAGSWMVTLQHT